MEEDIQNYSPIVMLHPVGYPPGTKNFPQKMSANSVQPFGQLS